MKINACIQAQQSSSRMRNSRQLIKRIDYKLITAPSRNDLLHVAFASSPIRAKCNGRRTTVESIVPSTNNFTVYGFSDSGLKHAPTLGIT